MTMTKELRAKQVRTGIVSTTTVGEELDKFAGEVIKQLDSRYNDAKSTADYYEQRVASYEVYKASPEADAKMKDIYEENNENDKVLIEVYKAKAAIWKAALDAARFAALEATLVEHEG